MRIEEPKRSGLRLWAVDRSRSERAAVPPAGDRVGEFLRASRENRGWTVEQVAKALRLSAGHLESIEASRFAALPGKAYIVGFIRAYAALLELDVDAVMTRLRSEMAHVPDQQDLVFPQAPTERRIPGGALISLSVCALIAVYAAWYYQTAQHHVRRDVVASTPIAVVEAPPVPEAAVAAALSSENSAVTLAPRQTAPISPAPVQVDATPGRAPAVALAPPPTYDFSSQSPIARSGAAVQAAEVPGMNWTAQAGPSSPIMLRATEPSWIEIRSAGGEVVYNKLMKPGDSYPVPSRPDLKLTTGNAGGLDIMVGNETVPKLGRSGAVMRDIALDATKLLGGAATARN